MSEDTVQGIYLLILSRVESPAAVVVTSLAYKDRIPRCYGVAIELSMGFPWYGIAMFLSAPMSMSNGRFVDNFC